MLNILIPAMGPIDFLREGFVPGPPLAERGRTLLERERREFAALKGHRLVFVVGREVCEKYNLRKSAATMGPNAVEIVALDNETAGAICTCLMAIHLIASDDPLIIANCDLSMDLDYAELVAAFESQGLDAGVLTFEGGDPTRCFVRVRDGFIVEAAEKRQISSEAVVGFYWFRHGSDFIEAAKRAVLKGEEINGRYYISSSLNELILAGKSIGRRLVPVSQLPSSYFLTRHRPPAPPPNSSTADAKP